MRNEYLPLGRHWKDRFEALLRATSRELVISSPYISGQGAEFVTSIMSESIVRRPSVQLVTDLSPATVAQGANDPSAVLRLAESFESAVVCHLPRLHAKVYVADTFGAIVTSGNLTWGGLRGNFEYGVEIRDAATVESIRVDVLDYASLGAQFSISELQAYAERALEVRAAFGKAQASIAKTARKRLEIEIQGIGDDLLRRQLRGGPVHQVFARTIPYVLRRFGPLETTALHIHVQGIHPDLCDDSIDRVIDGEHFGKKWKHQVRSAQSHLKRKGLIELRNGKWRLLEPSSLV